MLMLFTKLIEAIKEYNLYENDMRDLERKNLLVKKSQRSKFYKNALNTWTVRDVNKLTSALIGRLKYLCIYTKGQYYYEEGHLKEELYKSK